jgi:hypothetical protein
MSILDQLAKPALGKSCGSCTMCCRSLEIEELKKPMGKLCANCTEGGGCGIYAERPKVCREFLCEWICERTLAPNLRPDRVGTILIDDQDADEYQAICDPSKPMAWRNPVMFKHLLAVAKQGRTVIAKSGLRAWRIYEDGHTSEWS